MKNFHQIRELVREFRKKAEAERFNNPEFEEYTEKLQELQERIKEAVGEIISEFNLESVGASGKYPGFECFTTPENADNPLALHVRYSYAGIEELIIED